MQVGPGGGFSVNMCAFHLQSTSIHLLTNMQRGISMFARFEHYQRTFCPGAPNTAAPNMISHSIRRGHIPLRLLDGVVRASIHHCGEVGVFEYCDDGSMYVSRLDCAAFTDVLALRDVWVFRG
jgi:hypothetical protein